MAKYADYLPKQDQVTKELESVQSQPKAYNIPDSVKTRFAGKSPEEIMEAYAEAQAHMSRQGVELGELRKTTQSLLALQSTSVRQEPAQPDKPAKQITVDDLYENPEATIGTVVEKKSQETSERIEKLERELATRSKAEVELRLERTYPGWKAEASKPEFLEWVTASPIRTRLAQAADSYDLDSANDLLERWYEKKAIANQAQATVTREQQFRDASLESSSPSDVAQVPTYSRADLQMKRIASKNGNRNAENYLKSHGAAIQQAYREGRITD